MEVTEEINATMEVSHEFELKSEFEIMDDSEFSVDLNADKDIEMPGETDSYASEDNEPQDTKDMSMNSKADQSFKPTHFYGATNIAVISRNPEMADMDNPRGEIHGHVALVVAEDDLGNRRVLLLSRSEAPQSNLEAYEQYRADSMAQSLNQRLLAGKPPVGFSEWSDMHPRYGSDAYLANEPYNEMSEPEVHRPRF
jgi:hypothetical protein